MLESADVVAFAAATDLNRARTFYEQTLGLPVVEQNDFTSCRSPSSGRSPGAGYRRGRRDQIGQDHPPVLAGVASAAGGQPEKGQAGRQAMNLHRDRLRGLPAGAVQAEPAGQGRAAADEVPLEAVVPGVVLSSRRPNRVVRPHAGSRFAA
jgi:catechol 2,3-dioxygenase-like lactoylglutathione lyase family enzyme